MMKKPIKELFDDMDRHNAWDFENAIQTNFVQTEVGRLENESQTCRVTGQKAFIVSHYFDYKPDLLILDEPTNHFDLEMIELLEDYFAKRNITLFMVTHDRFF